MTRTLSKVPHPAMPVSARLSAARLAAVACALLSGPVLAQKPMVILEEVLETTSGLVPLPGSPDGSVTARECRDCPSVRLEFGNDTRYFVGKEAVSYNRFRQLAALGDGRLYVYFTPETRVLTRLRLSAASTAK
jgi:hypothetical protein